MKKLNDRRRPTILVDGHVLDSFAQGTCTYIAGLYSALANTNAFKIVIASTDRDSLARWGLEHRNIEWIKMRARGRLGRLLWDLPRLERKVCAEFAHYQYVIPFLPTKTKRIVTIHDVLFLTHPHLFSRLYRYAREKPYAQAMKRANIVCTTSEYSTNVISEIFGRDPKELLLTRAAVDQLAEKTPQPISMLRDKPFVAYVSRFEKRKNQHRMVEAFLNSQAYNCDDNLLVLVGSPKHLYHDLSEVLAKDIKSKVHILEGLTTEEIVWLYKNSKAHIYCSEAEGFGLPVLEAIIAGGISCAPALTAMREFIPYGVHPFDPSNGEDLILLLEKAFRGDLSPPSLVQQRKLAEDFSWGKAADSLVTALRGNL